MDGPAKDDILYKLADVDVDIEIADRLGLSEVDE